MSKRSELLTLLSGYVNGLPRGEIIKRLPESWFVTVEHGKEVQNALDGLRRQGLVDRAEVGDGVWNWVATGKAEAPEPEVLDFTQTQPAGIARIAARFVETIPEPERFEIGTVATLPEGIEEVRRYRVAENGSEWETPEEAAAQREKVLLLRRIEAFVVGWVDQGIVGNTRALMVDAIEAWEQAQTNRRAA